MCTTKQYFTETATEMLADEKCENWNLVVKIINYFV